MKYLLRLANGDGKSYFEVVGKYTYDNYKFALADDGESPRYVTNEWIVVNDDGSVTLQLCGASPCDLAILVRGLGLPQAPPAVPGGFIREAQFVRFRKGKTVKMLDVKTGKTYTEDRAAA